MIRKVSAPALVVTFLFIVGIAFAATAKNGPARPPSANDALLPAFSSIAGHGMLDLHAYSELQDLSDDIGARVTGSPQCNAAIEWGLDTMKKIGLQNVHAEPWQIFRGWTRISADAEVISPAPHKLMVDSMGWVGSTPAGGVDADLVTVNVYNLQQEEDQNFSKWRGKVIMAVQQGPRPENGMAAFAEFGPFLQKAHDAGAVAVIGGQGGGKSQGMHLTHTGALGFNTFYDIPVVSIAAEDQEILERLIAHGKTVRIHINVQNKVTNGPANTANVVGEIPGSEHPEQIIVVGGHLDSWDLAEGSTDNGMGTSCTLGAADAIQRS
ncbi:MAG: M28 family peptidase, partial [Candidatus Acidiferrales bacterium]